MQKLATTLLVSCVSASNELFLNRHQIKDEVQNLKLNIDTN